MLIIKWGIKSSKTKTHLRIMLKNCIYEGSEGWTSLVNLMVITTVVPSDSLLLSRIRGLSSDLRRLVVKSIVPSKMYLGRTALWLPRRPFLT